MDSSSAHRSPRVADLPPSAKLVMKVLEYNDALTQQRIVARTRLSQRTVRDALDRLASQDLIEKDIYPPDGRQNLYRLRESLPPEATEIEIE